MYIVNNPSEFSMCVLCVYFQINVENKKVWHVVLVSVYYSLQITVPKMRSIYNLTNDNNSYFINPDKDIKALYLRKNYYLQVWLGNTFA